MNKNIEDILREQAAGILPDAVVRAVKSYSDIIAQKADARDAKAFTAWQNACKATLAHIILLMKFARQAGLADSGPDYAALIAQAESDVARYREARDIEWEEIEG